MGDFRPQKARKALRCSGRRNRRQLITRRSLVQVQPPQPQNRLISQEIRRFFFTFCLKKFSEKLRDFAKFAVDPNRDPDGAKNRPGGGISASGFPVFSLASEGICQNFSHGFRRLLLGCCRNVGVGVQSEPCREMSQHPGHRLDVHAVLKGQGCERVPEVVEPDFGQSRPLQNPVEHMEHAVWGDRAAGGRGEYPGTGAGFLSLLFQNLDGVLRQEQCPVGVLGF